LFPHLTVRENILFGLQMHRVSGTDAGRRAERVMDLLQIRHLAKSYPDQLSGGQQQRTALARTLVVEPAVLLLDEPLSALDRQLRDTMRAELRQLLKAVNITTIIVTHDQDEAFALSDRLAVMLHGKIEQVGTPSEVYLRPTKQFVANFLGGINYIGGKVSGFENDHVLVRLHTGHLVSVKSGSRHDIDTAISIAVRPEVIGILPKDTPRIGSENLVPAALERINFQGGLSHYHFRLVGGDHVTVTQTPNAGSPSLNGLAPNSEVTLCWAAESGAILGTGAPPSGGVANAWEQK